MTRIELTPNDASILNDVLQNRLEDLRMEISHTDRQDYRTMLRVTQKTIEHVLAQLRSETTDS